LSKGKTFAFYHFLEKIGDVKQVSEHLPVRFA
jgi:hypothetical protein